HTSTPPASPHSLRSTSMPTCTPKRSTISLPDALPILVEAEVNLGLAYQSLFEYDLAVRHLAKALRKRPNLLGPTVIVGMDYLKLDRKSTRLNSSHVSTSYAVFCLKKKKTETDT